MTDMKGELGWVLLEETLEHQRLMMWYKIRNGVGKIRNRLDPVNRLTNTTMFRRTLYHN